MTVTASQRRRLRFYSEPELPARRLRQIYHVHLHNAESGGFAKSEEIGHVRLDEGKVFVDELPVLRPRIGEDGISWHQHADGNYTSGQLSFGKGRTELHGFVSRGTKPEDAVIHHVLATTVTPVDWATKITAGRHPAGTEPSSVPAAEWEEGLSVSIGYAQEVGDRLPRAIVLLGGEDISDFTFWSIDPKTQQTVITFELVESTCDLWPAAYLAGRLAFDQMVSPPTCAGTVTSTCADQAKDGDAYLWTGEVATAGMPQAAPTVAEPIELSADDLLADSGLSLAELLSLVPDQEVARQCNAMVVENMKWAMGQNDEETTWLSEFLGERPPALDPNRQKLIQEDLSWYQENFTKSYFSFAFQEYSGENEPAYRLSEADALKLTRYMKTGMAKEAGFVTQQNGVYMQAFVEAKPRLRLYLQDGGEKWANELYAAITEPAQMVLMVNRIYSSQEPEPMGAANRWATLLTALQGTGEKLAQQYIEQLTAAVFAASVHEQALSNKDTVMDWLPEWLQHFLTQMTTGGSVPDEGKVAAKQMEELLAQYGGDYSRLAGEIADLLVNANGADLLQKTRLAEAEFAKNHPNFPKAAKIFFVLSWGAGLFAVIQAFQKWKNLSPEDKANAILSTVQLAVGLVEAIPALCDGASTYGLKIWRSLTNACAGEGVRDSVVDIQEVGQQPGENWVRSGADELSPLCDAENGAIDAAGTEWADLFAAASKFLAVVGVVVSAALAVVSTISFIEELGKHQPIAKEVLDGLMVGVNILMTVCIIGDLLLASSVFAIAAPVLALVGIVIAIVELCVVKPENPLTKFMKDTAQPFVDSLGPQEPVPGEGTKVAFA